MTKSNKPAVLRGIKGLLRLATGNVSLTNAVGVVDGIVGLGDVGKAKLYQKKAENWSPLDIGSGAGSTLMSLLDPEEKLTEWGIFPVAGTKILVHRVKAAHRFWAETNPEGVLDALRSKIWQDGSLLTLDRDEKGKTILVPQKNKISIIDSDARRLYWSKLEPVISEKCHRTVLFFGNYGVGKKTLALALASCATQRLEGRGILIIPKLASTAEKVIAPILDLISLALPGVLIFSDVDQARKSSVVTEFINEIREKIPVVIVTTNLASKDKLPATFKIPGQFDEILPVVSLGVEFAKSFLGQELWALLDEVQRSVVAKWPVSYLSELKRQVKTVGAETTEVIMDLQSRLS